jgi:ribosome-binding factor A
MKRSDRVEELIRQEVAAILRERVSDPRIHFVSVTEVELSPDLRNATIYVSIYGPEKEKAAAMAGLLSATSFIRGELGHRLALRLTPEIRFVRDDSIERGSKVLGIMQQLTNEKSTGRYKTRAKKS